MNSPTPAAARIALTKASATGLRSTLAIPGRASSSEEICDPPSSAGIEHAAPTLKVAPSYIGPTRPSRIFQRFCAELRPWSAVTTLAGEHEALGLRSGGVDLDLRERLVLGAVHGHLRGQPPNSVRDTPPGSGVKAAHLPGVATFQPWDDAESRNTERPKRWR